MKPSLPLAMFVAAAAAVASAGTSLVEGDFTLTTGYQKDAICRSPASMRLGYGSFNPIEVGEFYVSTLAWGKVFPQTDKILWWNVEEHDGTVTFTTKTGSTDRVMAVATYALHSNSLSMKLTVDVPEGTKAGHIVWDLFLSEPLFSGAAITVDGADKGTLKLDACPDGVWAPIFTSVKRLTAKTKVGTWQFDLGSDPETSWMLRGARDAWRPDNLRTFTLFYDHKRDVSKGIKLALSVDMTFTPASAEALADFKAEKRAAFMEAVLKKYGYPLSPAEMPTRLVEKADWLAKKVCSVSATLKENGIDPAAAMVIPEPKIYKRGKSAFKLPATVEIAASAAHEAAIEVLSGDLALYKVTTIQVTPGKSAPIVMGVAASEPALAKLCAETAVHYQLLKPEGYALVVTPEYVIVAGADERGVLYGAQTLRQLIRNNNGNPEIPETLIMDWPDLKVRGCYVAGATAAASSDEIRRLIRDTYSFSKANALVAEITWTDWQWATHPEVSSIPTGKYRRGPARPLEDLRQLAQYAKKYKMDFIPGVFTYGKVEALLQSHPEIAEEPDNKKSGAYCPSKTETYALIFDLMGEIIETTGCSTLHIGHDEIEGMARCPLCKSVPPGDLFANDVNRIARWLAAKKVRTIIWGDMLLDFTDWDKKNVTSAHSNFKTFGNLPVHLGLEKIDKNVIIDDWHYRDEDKDLPTFKYFVDAGHEVIGTPWFRESNNYYSALRIKQYGGVGIIGSDWGFLASRSPLATCLLGVTYAWNLLAPDPDKLPFDPERVLAASTWKRDRPSRIVGAVFEPVPLATAANKPLSGGRDAWFGLGGENDLACLSSGLVRLFGTDYLIGKSGVIVGREDKERGVLKNSNPILVNAKVASLVFLHTMTVDEPTVVMKTYGTYRVTFASGKTADIPIDGGNIAHWLPGSIYQNCWGFKMSYRMDAVLAWQGCTLSGKEIGLHAYEWVNPTPHDAIVSVDLSAQQDIPGLQIGLVALTAVKDGDRP